MRQFVISAWTACLVLVAPCTALPQGSLQFKSGFDDNVAVSSRNEITGTDLTAPDGINSWDNIPAYLTWPEDHHVYLEGGSLEISQDPVDPTNKVLHFHNIAPEPGEDHARTQWSMRQGTEMYDPNPEEPNLFDKQFYRYRMFIPSDIKDVIGNSSAPWYQIWESHAWESDQTRHDIFLSKPYNGNWYFQVRQQHPEGTTVWQDTDHMDVTVPFDQWFTLEVFFKYHETDGEFYVAIAKDGEPRQVVGHYVGKTKYGTKLRDQMVFKMYHSADWFNLVPGGTHQYYDDFEIWSDFPSGYFDNLGTIKQPKNVQVEWR